MERQYHIGLDAPDGAETAILPGDPGRVEFIAGFLENPRFLANSREYTSWAGESGGKRILVISTGMGGPSAAICVEELYRIGVRTFIRVGTCGGMSLDVRGGDVIIAQAAIRAEGTSREYAPIEVPACADFGVTNALVNAAKERGASYHVGTVHCKDSFYGQHEPERMPVSCELKQKWDAYIKCGALASEMESAALFVTAQTLGARAGCVLNVLWNQERRARGLPDPTCADMTEAVKIAVLAAAAV